MTVLIIQHVPNNQLGPLEASLTRHGQHVAYLNCRLIKPAHLELKGVTGLILLGGMESIAKGMRHPYLIQEQALIHNALTAELPIFGICFGAQMLAHALGSQISRNRVTGKLQKEVGWHPLVHSPAGKTDPILRHLTGCAQFQWHGDTFELPPDATHLASTALCQQQAFKLAQSKRPVYGVQFHPEITLEGIEAWLTVSRSLTDAEKEALWQESLASFAQWYAASHHMFNAFCEHAF